MKERRGALGRASGLAESVVAGVKRRQAARAPKVMLYDDDGRPRTLAADSQATEDMIEVARRMIELAGPDEPPSDEFVEEE